jgi:hypothetical protein
MPLDEVKLDLNHEEAGINPEGDPYAGWEKLLADCRFAVRAFTCGLLLAWALVSTLKYMDMMPDHMTWTAIIVGPAILFVALSSIFASVLWLRSRWWKACFPILLLCLAAMAALALAGRG